MMKMKKIMSKKPNYYYASKEIPTHYVEGNRIYDLDTLNEKYGFVIYRLSIKGAEKKSNTVYEMWRIMYRANGYFIPATRKDDYCENQWIGNWEWMKYIAANEFGFGRV